MKLIIASNNKNKIAEIKKILSPWFEEILSMREAGVEAEVEEDGKTFEENALKKASEIQKLLPGCAVLSDDSGLEVDALGGEPGVYSARYAGGHGDDLANNQKLLKNLENTPDDARTARFVCAVALVREGKAPIVLRGESEGVILRAPRGTGGFGYDPLFYVPRFQKTYSELTPDEKNADSHRGRALRKLHEVLQGETRA